MGDMGDYWRDIKTFFKEKNAPYLDRIYPMYEELLNHPLTKRAGNQHRIENWDFWRTGTVYNYQTGEHSDIETLHKKYCNENNKG